MEIHTPATVDYAALDRLGDQIAELSAHLEAATARLLDLIREFDERGGWNGGFKSCAEWLSWRVGLDPGAARERVRVARALANLPRLAQALAHGELSYAKGSRPHSRCHAGDRRASARYRSGRYRVARRADRSKLAPGRPVGGNA